MMNGINFIKPDIKKFPLLKILNLNLKYISGNNFVSLNDALVKK